MKDTIFTLDRLSALSKSLKELKEEEFNEQVLKLACKIAERLADQYDQLQSGEVMVLHCTDYAGEVFNEVIRRNIFPDIEFGIRHHKDHKPSSNMYAKLIGAEWGDSIKCETKWFINEKNETTRTIPKHRRISIFNG